MRLGDITLGLWGWEGIKLYFPPHTLQTSLFSVKLFWETSYRKVEQIIYAGPYFTFHCLCWGWGVKPSWTKMKHIPSSWPSSSISIDKSDLTKLFSEKTWMCECCRTIDLIPHHICAIRKDTCGWLDRIGKGREGRRGICRTEGCPRVGRGIRCGCTPWRVLMGFDLKPSNNITQHSPIQPAHHQSSQSITPPPPHHDEPVAVQACRCHLSPLSVIRPIKHPLYPSSSSSSFIFFSNSTLSITGFT